MTITEDVRHLTYAYDECATHEVRIRILETISVWCDNAIARDELQNERHLRVVAARQSLIPQIHDAGQDV